jgi:hypothetical protein
MASYTLFHVEKLLKNVFYIIFGRRSPYGNRSFELSVTRDSLPEVLPLAPRHVRNLQHRNAFMRRRLGCGIPDFFSVLCVMFGGWRRLKKRKTRSTIPFFCFPRIPTALSSNGSPYVGPFYAPNTPCYPMQCWSSIRDGCGSDKLVLDCDLDASSTQLICGTPTLQ